MIECTSQQNVGNNDILIGLNHMIFSLPSILNLQSFYDPIDVWMEEVFESQSRPWHGLISQYSYPSLFFKQQV